jgi:hypothetical protein
MSIRGCDQIEAQLQHWLDKPRDPFRSERLAIRRQYASSSRAKLITSRENGLVCIRHVLDRRDRCIRTQERPGYDKHWLIFRRRARVRTSGRVRAFRAGNSVALNNNDGTRSFRQFL